MAELVELDELDEMLSFDWLGCNTQHVVSVTPGACKFFSLGRGCYLAVCVRYSGVLSWDKLSL